MSEAVELSEVKRRLLQQLLSGGAAASDKMPAPDGVVPRAADDRPLLSAEQSHVWLHASMAPGLPLYNEPITIHRRGSFDLAILKRAFAELLRRLPAVALEPVKLEWRENLGLRGLKSLPVRFESAVVPA